eukprot:scaffold85_cov135-Skeletonema_marinoi.AAC.3
MSLLYHQHQNPKSIHPRQILFELHEEEVYVGNKLEIDYNYGYGSEDAGLKPYAYEYISSILNRRAWVKCLVLVHFARAESPEKNEHCKQSFHTHDICNAINRDFEFGRGHGHGSQESRR